MIEIKRLNKSYGDKKVLQDLNLQIEEGSTLVILGRSGAGKSVLLKQIIGLEKPDSGSILINGVDIVPLRGKKLQEATHDIGMLFQGSALFDSLTVGQNTAFYFAHHHSLEPQEVKERVTSALKLVGLEGTENLMPSDLSGGMRKRAALARLIAYRPKVLLYDEPTTGLDPITAMQINDLILKVQKELGATSIVVTHDLCSAFSVADRIALNHEGKILYNTTKEEFVRLEDPLVKQFLQNADPTAMV
jgi:phospholipid/cholesterol/gamma-HCH transport system ATP-binding protein